MKLAHLILFKYPGVIFYPWLKSLISKLETHHFSALLECDRTRIVLENDYLESKFLARYCRLAFTTKSLAPPQAV